MRFMWSLGRTYSDYYFFNYGKDSGLMFERLSVTLLKLENRMQEVLNPRFKPGDLVSIDGEKSVCTVLSNPVIDEKLGKIMVNVMVEGKVFPVENKSLRSVKRLSRNHA
jgi:hypothetical protein